MTENEALGYLKNSKRQKSMLEILPGSDIGNTIIKALEELQQYRAIGTPEECRAAMKKQKPKLVGKGTLICFCKAKMATCPVCAGIFLSNYSGAYCPNCGQRLKGEISDGKID